MARRIYGRDAYGRYALIDPGKPAPYEPREKPTAGGYEALTVAELRDIARDRGMPTSGRKAELIDALRETN